ncbi:MAG: 3-dehydroquinate synthase [Candidatus Vecturithrix sp.]|jgi:3-dehydroquinate synthase|nr:3-dehydroquinate synthase [Candidatus Vecturithrix sp.]
MTSKPNIILTGFMATGKTTVGKLLAEQLDYEFIDTDQLIEARSGMTIPEIFRQKGETAFREMEAAIVQELAEKEKVVISTGGRLMLDAANAAALSKRGRVFCLVATPEEILKRVSHDSHAKRPLLETPNPMQRIVELLQQRKESYHHFSQFATSEKTPDEVTRHLLGIFQANPDLCVPITARDDRYEFIVGGGILPFVAQLAGISGPIAVITDSNVGPLYAESCGKTDIVITVTPGQQHKTLTTVQAICEELFEKGFDRSGTILALGGSLISGLAGFVAGIYMRGVDCVQCPTSLLAMVDTSIGGKAGINLTQGRNLLGVFKQPKAVVADVATLQSLSPREFANGMAEVIKHSLIADTDLLEKIEQGNWQRESDSLHPPLDELQALVAQAIQVKIQIIQEDPFEKGRRTILNLGHTFAYAIELVSEQEIGHGEAVAMGLVAAANLSARQGYCDPGLQKRIERTLQAAALPARIPAKMKPEQLLQAMKADKKKKGERLRFVLLRDIEDVFVTDAVPPNAVLETIRELRSPSE